MTYPENLKYTKAHLWVKKDGDTVKIGITDYAQDQLGDILFVDLPSPGDQITAGDTFTEVESSKTASELPAPVSGEIVAVNDELDDSPEKINEGAYDAWIVEVKTDDDLSGLLSAADYQAGLD